MTNLRIATLGAARITPAALVKPAREVDGVEVVAVAAHDRSRAEKLAGKHVLCEKPFTANAEEAQSVADAAAATDRVVMEAFHYRYHPVAQRMIDVVAGGEIGDLRHVETAMCIPLPMPKDIRYRLDLAGGATMDTGCYAVHMNRSVAGAEPTVISAQARTAGEGVDRWMRAEFHYPGGVTGTMTCALWSSTLLRVAVRAFGTDGAL